MHRPALPFLALNFCFPAEQEQQRKQTACMPAKKAGTGSLLVWFWFFLVCARFVIQNRVFPSASKAFSALAML